MQTYDLSSDDLMKYARVCKIESIYGQITPLMEMLKMKIEKLGTDELVSYQELVTELECAGVDELDRIDDFDSYEELKPQETNPTNLIIYSSYIDESKNRTINAHSGKEEQTQKAVAKFIQQLAQADYQSLRTKGCIHQMLNVGENTPCYIEGNAFERIGSGTTKVNYLRLSVSKKNREAIRENLGIDFGTLYFVLSYGDFKNEGISEEDYYRTVYSDMFKYNSELLHTVNLFANDFTSDTLATAINIIKDGIKTTDEMTSAIKKHYVNM